LQINFLGVGFNNWMMNLNVNLLIDSFCLFVWRW